MPVPLFEKGSKLSLSRDERSHIENGELGIVAEKLLHVVTEQGFGRVSLRGFSQGADVALASGRKLYRANLDAGSVVIGDPVGEETRSPRHLAADFPKAGPKQLKQSIERTNLRIETHSSKFKETLEFALFGASALLLSGNRTLYKGMGVNTFESRIQAVLNEGEIEKLVVAYGTNDAIAKPSIIEPALQRIYDNNGENSVLSVSVGGGNHSWGDQLTLLAKLYTMTA